MKVSRLKEAVLQMLKKIKNENKNKNNGKTWSSQVMFSGEIYYYWPLNSVDKSLVKHRFSLHNLLRY